MLLFIKRTYQGTAGVALAGLLGAVRAQGRPMIDFPKMKIVVAGAGRYCFIVIFTLPACST